MKRINWKIKGADMNVALYRVLIILGAIPLLLGFVFLKYDDTSFSWVLILLGAAFIAIGTLWRQICIKKKWLI